MRGAVFRGRVRALPVIRSGVSRTLQALAVGVVAAPVAVLAQSTEVTLPEVRVIGTTPLSTSTPRRSTAPAPSPRRVRTARPAAATPAPAPVTTAPAAADPG